MSYYGRGSWNEVTNALPYATDIDVNTDNSRPSATEAILARAGFERG